MAKKRKKQKEEDKYYSRLEKKLDIKRTIEQEREVNVSQSTKVKSDDANRTDQEQTNQEEEPQELNEETDQEQQPEEEEKEEKEEKDKEQESQNKEEGPEDELKDKAQDEIKDEAKEGVKKEAEKEVAEEGGEAVSRGAAAKSGGKAKAAARAASRAAKQAALAIGRAIAAFFSSVSWIVLLVLAIILILAVIAIWFYRGTDAPQMPNPELAEDRQDVAETACWAGDCQQAQTEAQELAEETTEAIEEVKEEAMKKYDNPIFAQAADKETFSQEFKAIENKKERLETNFQGLGVVGDSKQNSLELALDNYQLINSTIADLNANKDQWQLEAEPVLESLAKLAEYNQKIMLALQATNSGQKKPVLAINQYDLRLIKDFKIDIRVIRLLNELAYRAQSSQAEGQLATMSEDEIWQIIRSPIATRAKKIAELSKPNKEWSQIKISRISQFDPMSREDEVTTESEASHSAHYGGKAIDISVVGNYSCKTKGWFSSKTRWHPCHVAYQTEYRPEGLENYLNPNFNNLASVISLPGSNSSQLSLDKAIIDVGLGQIAQELDIDPSYLANRTISAEDIGAAYLENQLNLPIGSMTIVAGEDELEGRVGQRYLEQVLGLPNNSIEGKTSREILISTGLALIREGLGLEHSNWQGEWNNLELGKAVIEDIYRVDYNQEDIEQLINSNQVQFARKTGIEEVTGDQEETVRAVGKAYQERLDNGQNDSGFSKGLGLYPSAINELKNSSNNSNTFVKVGSIQIANSLGIDPFPQNNQSPIDQSQLISLINNGQIEAPLGVSSEIIQSIIASPNEQTREEELKKIGEEIIDRIQEERINPEIREALKELTGIDYYQVGITDIKEILADQEKRADYIKLIGQKKEEELFYHYQPTIGNYQLTIYDYESIKEGNWQEVVDRVGSAYVEMELGLPGDSFTAIIDSGINTQEAMARAGLALILDNLGVRQSNSYDWFSGFHDNEDGEDDHLTLKIGQAVVESRGLTSGSFFGDIGQVIEQNGKARVAASLNISVEELDHIINSGEVSDEEINRKLIWADFSLGLDEGITSRFYQGEISAEDYAKRVAQAQLLGLNNQKIANLIGIEGEIDISGNISQIIMNPGETGEGQLLKTLSELFEQYTGNKLGWPKDFLISQITNDEQSRNKALSAGIDRLSLILTDGNRNRANIVSNLLERSYIQGENITEDDYINAGLSYLGVAGSTITDREVISNVFNGNLNTAFSSIKEVVIKDQTSQTLIGGWVDMRLEEAIGLNREEIGLIEQTLSGWQNGEISDNRMITVLNQNFELVDPQIESLIRGEGDYLDVTEMVFDDQFRDIFGISTSEAREIRDTYQSYRDGSIDERELYSSLAVGLGIDRDIVEGVVIAENYAAGGGIDGATIGYLVSQTGIDREIDGVTGINGFTRGLITGLTTGNWLDLGVSILGNLFGIGETKCQDPMEITQKHIRELVGWTLRAEEPPFQIGVFREEDINYFNGLTDEGEPDPNIPNLIEINYGPVEDRGNRGLFANKHMWNHIHIGY